MGSFRFSPNPNQAHRVDWQPWGQAAFARAQEENKPVLLSISAVWCYWCHVMDETSYSDPDVERFINQHFVPVRVDTDHRPDINARYNVGGWPTTAFLTAHGGLIGGATYLPPDQFLAMLTEFKTAYQEDRPRLYDRARELLRQRRERVSRVAAGAEVGESLVDQAARGMAGAYDAINGGFGLEPKFPNGPILQFLAHLARTTGEDFYRVMLAKTLDRMAGSAIFDHEEGGFFRHCARSDWTEPQWEKVLEDNLSLAKVYLDAYLLTDRESYRQVASRTVDYLMEQLFDPQASGFRGSQGAHSEHFGLPLEARRGQAAPPVDPACYASSSAQAVSLLLDASWKLARPGLMEAAFRVLERIDGMAQAERLSHVYTQDGPGAEPAFLADWAYLLHALLDAYACSPQDEKYLERARAVAVHLLDRFFDQRSGGFFDIETDPEAVGYLQVREKPLPENTAAALGLLKLYQATRNDDYRQVAEATLSAYVNAYREYGEFAASYGLAVHLLKNPLVEVTVEGRPGDAGTQAMLRAAARLSSPNLQIKPVLAAHAGSAALAHVCLDTVCLPPVSDPEALADTVSDMASGQASPFENIFDRFPIS